MKKIFTLALIAIFCLSANAQKQLTLTFTGKDSKNKFVKLDKVVIKNENRGWCDTLFYPDTTLILNNTTGISDFNGQAIGLTQNVPNPFNGTTNVTLNVPSTQQVRISIMDINGREIVATQKQLNQGTHNLQISLTTPQTYLLNVKMNNYSGSIKMINFGQGGSNSIQFNGTSSFNAKSDCLESINKYANSDQLKVTGYTTYQEGIFSSTQTITPEGKNLMTTFIFDNLRKPTTADMITYPAFHITDSSFYTGGFVNKENGGEVFEGGICWDTLPAPTVDSNSHYTVQTPFHNAFTTFITGLKPNTTYYFRCYGINPFGLSYGDEYSIKTNAKGDLAKACEGVETVTDVDGNVYHTVQVGNQCWLKENMRVRHYPDGTAIPYATATTSEYFKGYYYYPEDHEEYVETYGLLYNFVGEMKVNMSENLQGICPNGWHVVTEEEWKAFTDYVLAQPDYNYLDYFSNDKSIDLTPSGYIYNHTFYTIGFASMMWSSSSYNEESGWIRMFTPQSQAVTRYGFKKCAAMSVRCIKD